MRRARLILVSLLALALAAAVAGTASAESVNLTVLDASGVNDPAQDLGRVFTFTGNASGSSQLYLFVKHRNPGGAPCAPTYALDSGDGDIGATSVSGSFAIQRTLTWDAAGPVLYCMWISYDSSEPTTPFSQVITFREPNGSIRLVSVGKPVARRAGQIVVSGSSEAPRFIYVKSRAAGGAVCGPTYNEDSGDGVLGGRSVNGAFSFRVPLTWPDVRAVQFCAWLTKNGNELSLRGRPAKAVIRLSRR